MSSYRSYHGLDSESEFRSETDYEVQSVSTWKVGLGGDGENLLAGQTDLIVDEFDEDEPETIICEETCPDYACRYCLTCNPECVVKCTVCNKWFCNGTNATSGSHIVNHMVRARHREAALHPAGPLADTALECYCCGSRNVFLLGYVPKKEDFMVVLICREPCLVNQAFKDSEWDMSKWEPLISNRMFLPWLVKEPEAGDKRRMITMGQVNKLEEVWKTSQPNATLLDVERGAYTGGANSGAEEEETTRSITLRYEDAYQYQHTFAPLVKMEADYDKRMKESQSQQNVKVRWDIALNKKRLAYFHFTKESNDIRLVAGDELRLRHDAGAAGQPWECQGTVTKITAQEEVALELRNAQQKGPWEDDIITDYTVEFVWKSTSFDRMQAAMRTFAVNDVSVSGHLYHRLLGHEPEPQEIRQYVQYRHQHYEAPNLPQLNHSQTYAVKKALTSPLQLIQGPPGTGKTVTSATIVYHMCRNAQEHCRQEGISPQHAQVLVCAPSNIAVDQLAEKLHKTGLSVVRVVAKSREHIATNVEYLCLHKQIAHLDTADNRQLQRIAELKARMGGELNQEDEKLFRQLTQKCEKLLLHSANVICCTCVGAGDARLSNMRFRQVLIDESTQATEPECLIPIMNGAKQVVLVGDHCQLGPVIMCKRAAKAGLHQSLFERLVHLNARPIRLEVQYRMHYDRTSWHPCLSEFPSHSFYDGSLQNGVTLKDRTYPDMGGFPWPKVSQPMFFYNSTGQEEISISGTSYLNRTEASNIEKMIAYFLKAKITPAQIGVITPYEGQRAYITTLLQRSAMTMQNRGFEEIEVASVDSFQGREKDFIILSCVRSNANLGIGFLNDPRRLNVALTRAKYGLVICGNAKVLGKVYKGTSLWLNLLAHLKKSELIVEGPLANLKPCQIQFEQPVTKWGLGGGSGMFGDQRGMGAMAGGMGAMGGGMGGGMMMGYGGGAGNGVGGPLGAGGAGAGGNYYHQPMLDGLMPAPRSYLQNGRY